jgi:hypothetical protein
MILPQQLRGIEMDVFEAVLIVIVAVSAGGAIGRLVYRGRLSRKVDQVDPPALAEIAEGVLRPLDDGWNQAVAASEQTVFAIANPDDPSRQAFLEVIPDDMSYLTEAGTPLEQGSIARYEFAYDSIVGALPEGASVLENALQAGKTLRILGPAELLAGLADGTMEMIATNGEMIGTVRDKGTGAITGQLRFGDVPVINPAGAALIVFQVMAAVSGQYYMARIDKKLEGIVSALDRIEQRLQAMNWAKAETARQLADEVRALVEAGEIPSRTDIERLNAADKDAREAFNSAKQHLHMASDGWTSALDHVYKGDERLLMKIDHDASDGGSKRTSRYTWARTRRRRSRASMHKELEGRNAAQEDVTTLLFAAAVRSQVGIMRVVLNSDGDPQKARRWADQYESDRAGMIDEIARLGEYYDWLPELTDAQVDERLGGMVIKRTKKLKSELHLLRNSIEVLNGVSADPQQILPAAPPNPVEPTVIEMRRGDSGRLEVYTATVRSTENPTPLATKRLV